MYSILYQEYSHELFNLPQSSGNITKNARGCCNVSLKGEGVDSKENYMFLEYFSIIRKRLFFSPHLNLNMNS